MNEIRLYATGRSGKRGVISVKQNGVRLQVECADAAGADAACVSSLCLTASISGDAGKRILFSRSAPSQPQEGNSLLNFYADGTVESHSLQQAEMQIDTDESSIQSPFPAWDLENLHAVFPVSLESETSQPKTTECLLTLQSDPLALQMWRAGSETPVFHYPTGVPSECLLGAAVFYHRSQKSESQEYQPLIALATNSSALSVFSPVSQKQLWSAKSFFNFENIPVNLRIAALCAMPTESTAPQRTPYLCVATRNKYLLLYCPLQRSSPIAVIRMKSLPGEPRCVTYAGGSAVVVGDALGSVVQFDFQKCFRRIAESNGEALELADDTAVRRVVLPQGGSGLKCIAPVDFEGKYDTDSSPIFHGDACPTYSTELFPYFLFVRADDTMQLFAAWSGGSAKQQRIQSVAEALLSLNVSFERCVWGLPGGKASAEAEISVKKDVASRKAEVGRFLQSRRPTQTVDAFLEANKGVARELLGWDTLEVVQE